ncbi:MAG TPA: beta-ketoacyl synthase N-terminal-like domain-containing protein [Tepidisphaeraceae bacterium]|nr:beta-ketoacyl synthase N-terminal-like domain-containing protein [Tepidisphaeraceae bacterium]
MNDAQFITGLGLVTPLGRDVDETWQALLAGRFIRDHARVRNGESFLSINELAFRAADQAIAQANWISSILADDATALIVGTSKGPVASWLDSSNKVHGSAQKTCVFGLAELSQSIAQDMKLGGGPRSVLSAACASGIHALVHAILLLRSGAVQRVLVVAAEASVHPIFVGSFKRLGVLAHEGAGCRPFDISRSGFLMSEAAAAICLESQSNHPIARIDRLAINGDAAHLTGIDPAGRALRHMLSAVMGSQPVDLVHAHATGTTLNDPVELAAIESCAENHRPTVYSHKGALGHSLGAAGLVSVVLNCLAHRDGLVPPNVRTTQPLATNRVELCEKSIRKPIRRSIALAAGFGGAMGAVSLIS